MKIKVLSSIAALSACALVSSNASAEDRSKDFKRWSVSAGWLHVMPQGKPNIMSINTAAKNGEYGIAAGAVEHGDENVIVPIHGLEHWQCLPLVRTTISLIVFLPQVQ